MLIKDLMTLVRWRPEHPRMGPNIQVHHGLQDKVRFSPFVSWFLCLLTLRSPAYFLFLALSFSDARLFYHVTIRRIISNTKAATFGKCRVEVCRWRVWTDFQGDARRADVHAEASPLRPSRRAVSWKCTAASKVTKICQCHCIRPNKKSLCAMKCLQDARHFSSSLIVSEICRCFCT